MWISTVGIDWYHARMNRAIRRHGEKICRQKIDAGIATADARDVKRM
jgi:hypothetical protein